MWPGIRIGGRGRTKSKSKRTSRTGHAPGPFSPAVRHLVLLFLLLLILFLIFLLIFLFFPAFTMLQMRMRWSRLTVCAWRAMFRAACSASPRQGPPHATYRHRYPGGYVWPVAGAALLQPRHRGVSLAVRLVESSLLGGSGHDGDRRRLGAQRGGAAECPSHCSLAPLGIGGRGSGPGARATGRLRGRGSRRSADPPADGAKLRPTGNR